MTDMTDMVITIVETKKVATVKAQTPRDINQYVHRKKSLYDSEKATLKSDILEGNDHLEQAFGSEVVTGTVLSAQLHMPGVFKYKIKIDEMALWVWGCHVISQRYVTIEHSHKRNHRRQLNVVDI